LADQGNSATKADNERRPLDQRSLSLLTRFLREWVLGRWRQLALAFLLMAAVAATTSAYGLIVKYLFDTLGAGDMRLLLPAVLVIIAVTLARSLFLYLQTVVTSKVVLRITVAMQKAGFEHLLGADFARIARDTPGHLVSRLTNDISAVQTAVMALLNTSVRDVLVVIATVAVMIYIDWALTLIVLVVYPIAAWPIFSIGQRLRRNARRTQAELADMTSRLTENLSGARLIKTFRLEEYAGEKTNAHFDEIYRLRMKAVRARASLDPMLEVLSGLALAGVTAFVGYRIARGGITIGGFMGFLTALFSAAQPIRGFGQLNAKLQEGLAAIERVYELLDEKPAIVDLPDAKPLEVSAGAIELREVGFSYGGKPNGSAEGNDAEPAGEQQLAICEFSLVVPGGKTVALVGRSGAGKSTIINLVPRLFEPQSGSILIDGQDIAHVTLASLRDAIAIVSQDITLFNDSVRANIALGRLGAGEEEIEAAAKAAAAHEFISDLPEGYDTQIGDRGMRLSGGQRQRLALARAILKDAPILLLDEATSALDVESERLVQEALARFSKGRTTLVIAHRLSTVQSANLIVVMEAGQIVETGTHEELLDAGGAYARLSRSQLLPPPREAA
jgi:subfamily B ATP-binding cassette protein MsbA